MKKQYKTFKQLVNTIAAVDTIDAYQEACADVMRSFEHEKITWQDYETFFRILNKLYDLYMEV